MQIPSFWAEARLEDVIDGRPAVVRRFGWSDLSVDDARRHAEERAALALSARRAGQRVSPVEARHEYGKANELPIREEVVERIDDIVITRNGYGARCLNVPDVLFVDVDFVEPAPRWPILRTLAMVAALGIAAAAILFGNLPGRPLLGLVVGLLVGLLVAVSNRKSEANPEAKEAEARAKALAFVEANPGTRVRVYRTPNGLRLLAMHRTYDPRGDETKAVLEALEADSRFTYLCFAQGCFRARLDPKPWRIGINEPMPPRRGKWPLESEFERLSRNVWVERFVAKSASYAACRYLETLGHGPADPRAEKVRELHDRHCRAETALPIA